ncbi:MAG: hypothetical protein P9L89_05385 [Candidatus Celaenobacter polaris]|nr:hypothetical protein [Candidatus Celaenobacter polaris]
MKELSISKYISFATPYAFVVASLYLFAFWGSFKINILEFVGFSDLVRLALYPLAISLILYLPGVALSQLVTGNSLPPGGGADTAIGRFGLKHWRFLVAIDIIIILAVALFLKRPEKWIVIPVFVSFLSTPLTHLDAFVSLIPNPRARGSILFLLIFVLGLAFATGKLQAYAITHGRAAYLVDIQSSGIQLDVDASGLSYVGYLADNFILYENATRRIMFVKGTDKNMFVLEPNPKDS